MNFDQALSHLLSLGHETLTIKLGLRNTETLLQALGNPEKSFPAVQIAGTNGKGSTAAFLDSICRSAGIRTGLFTSPHLISITERIRVNGEPIARDEFARITTKVRAAADELVARGQLETLPTFFEHVTAIALVALREAKVELAILETGLGGRLDSTTAAGADIVAITPIAMDHQEYLGNSIEDIAGEKAAIIRPGVTAVIAPQDERALEVILQQCKASEVDPILIQAEGDTPSELPARIHHPTRAAPAGTPARSRFPTATRDGRCIVTFESDSDVYDNITLGLRGRHQIANALTAIALAEALRERGFPITRAAIIRGVETATHPGRLEMWDGPPRMLFDGAHNPAAARALREYLDEFVKEPIVMIFGAMRDKALDEMTAALFPADTVILTALDNPRAASIDALIAALPDSFDRARTLRAANVDDALRLVESISSANALVCVTGSLYLVGAVQQTLRRAEQSAVVS